MRGITTKRGQEMVEITAALNPAVFEPFTPLVLDVSQSLGRNPLSVGVRSIIQNSRLFSFMKQGLLSAEDEFKCLGFPSVNLAGLSESTGKSLLGEAMAPPVVAALTFALLCSLNTGWQNPLPQTS